jgi:uncharacterized membrane protein
MSKFVKLSMLTAVVMAAGCLAPGLACAEAQQSLAASLKVSVFPAQQQTAEQQASDEKLCYDWAVQNTGADPLAPPKKEEAQAQQPAQQQTSRRGAGGAVKGAAVGAVIGEVANDDASQGAAVGAAVGVIGARRKAKGAEQAAQAEAKQTAEKTAAASEEQVKNFKNGFAACLEGKKYTVKY